MITATVAAIQKDTDKYGRSNTTFYVNVEGTRPAANIVKVKRQPVYIVTNWFTGDQNDTRKFDNRRDAVNYAHELCARAAATADDNTDEGGYEFCPDGECGACDNTGLSCLNPENPETGWAV